MPADRVATSESAATCICHQAAFLWFPAFNKTSVSPQVYAAWDSARKPLVLAAGVLNLQLLLQSLCAAYETETSFHAACSRSNLWRNRALCL